MKLTDTCTVTSDNKIILNYDDVPVTKLYDTIMKDFTKLLFYRIERGGLTSEEIERAICEQVDKLIGILPKQISDKLLTIKLTAGCETIDLFDPDVTLPKWTDDFPPLTCSSPSNFNKPASYAESLMGRIGNKIIPPKLDNIKLDISLETGALND